MVFPELENIHKNPNKKKPDKLQRLCRYVKLTFDIPPEFEGKNITAKFVFYDDSKGAAFDFSVQNSGKHVLIFPYHTFIPFNNAGWLAGKVICEPDIAKLITGADVLHPPADIKHFFDLLWFNVNNPAQQRLVSTFAPEKND